MKNKIHFVIIGTNMYFLMAVRLIKNITSFSTDFEPSFTLYTNVRSPESCFSESISNSITFIKPAPANWEGTTDQKHPFVLDQARELTYFLDADTNALKPLYFSMFDKPLLFAQHFIDPSPKPKPFERNPKSSACIVRSSLRQEMYFQGAFFGGKKEQLIDFCKNVIALRDKDKSIKYMAIWQDDSYLNKFCHENKESISYIPLSEFPFVISDKGSIPDVRKQFMPSEAQLLKLKELKDVRIRLIRGEVFSEYSKSFSPKKNIPKTKEGIISMFNNNYNPIILNGEEIKKGNRKSDNRLEVIKNVLRKYKRNFSVLDLGSAEGYFTFSLANEFDCSVVCIEGSNSMDYLCDKNNLQNVFLLKKYFKLEHLKKLSEVQYFDVILALNVVHHFDEPFQEVLDVLMSMCNHCFFEHPSDSEGPATKNYKRFSKEPIDLSKYNPESLTKTRSFGTNERELIHLTDTSEKVVTRATLSAPKYENPPVIKPSFNDILIKYPFRDENRVFISGIDLASFKYFNGHYPNKDSIIRSLRELPPKKYKDLGPANVLLSSGEINIIDQEHRNDPVNTIEKLIKHLYG